MPQHLRLATRAGALALAQAELAVMALRQAWPQLAIKIVPIVSDGDRITGRLADAGGKELFVQALQQALHDGDADAACHSLKDMGRNCAEFHLGAFLPRADARDALVGATLRELTMRPTPIIATSSPRRTELLRLALPEAQILPMRGNVDTRLRKHDAGDTDALLLATAGLERLRLGARIAERLDPLRFVPAAGQGTIVLECRSDDSRVRKLLTAVNDSVSCQMALAERACVASLDGDCYTPLGAHAIPADNGQIQLHCVVAYGGKQATGSAAGTDPTKLGAAAAAALLDHGGRALLANFRGHRTG